MYSHRFPRMRRGPPNGTAGATRPLPAWVATAHQMARTVYSRLKNKVADQDSGAPAYQRQPPDRELAYRQRKAAKLGFALTPNATASHAALPGGPGRPHRPSASWVSAFNQPAHATPCFCISTFNNQAALSLDKNDPAQPRRPRSAAWGGFLGRRGWAAPVIRVQLFSAAQSVCGSCGWMRSHRFPYRSSKTATVP